MKIFKLGLILITISAFIFGCTQTENKNSVQNTNKPSANETKENPTPTPDELAVGRKNYKEQCARCHQDDGTGGKVDVEGKILKVEDLTTDKMKAEPDKEYIEYMVEGIPDEGMPSFKDKLTKEEMNEVVKFIRQELQGKSSER